ncbi:TetR/AcrR family transcriptional regulator [Solidesulfovibrio sp. C21]|uniref:TetR/AcrR family transcriptional regulator n=1 Tax=Solidesulfovibrio sp. C21 TaxID=3398613 RepID=UPI0039FC00AA
MDYNDTRTRIIEAAIKVFLEKGYATATIRGICAQAEANLAAVNYHFGSKDSLYAAALERIMASCDASYPIAEGLAEASSPEERLRRFIRNLFRLLFPEDPEYARRSELIWLGLGNASPAITVPIERFIRPIKDILESIIQEILGPVDAEALRLCVESIFGQQLFHAQNRALITHLYPDKMYTPTDVARLAAHVYIFSLAGLEAVRKCAN